ncbi:rod shape-determining protein MreD [Thioalkalicoccus limnaeus]|uniref:Rod shape-determining protein MreD n=1 Tax=Thioalkalicoccus limnaeus TaxID=120681 RepID=A0ABV4BCQ1_9GAMM
MTKRTRRGGGVILATLAVAMILTLLPMPDWSVPYRPPWIALTLLYWVLAVPERVGVFSAFGLGLLLDVVSANLLGQQALSLAVMAYLAEVLHRRIRLFPPLQQTLSIWMLLLVERLLFLWLLVATGQPLPPPVYWAGTVTGMLLWPWLFVVLRDLRRRFRVA